MAELLIINGPNLNLLGQREPKLYGNKDLPSLMLAAKQQAKQLGHELNWMQSNAEHELVDAIQQTQADCLIINAAAYTHTSIAIRDALLATATPFIEVHLSNVFAREAFRHDSFLSDIAIGVITGLGQHTYTLAVQAADYFLTTDKEPS